MYIFVPLRLSSPFGVAQELNFKSRSNHVMIFFYKSLAFFAEIFCFLLTQCSILTKIFSLLPLSRHVYNNQPETKV